MLVDNKFLIGIPFFHLKISDNLFTLIEVIKGIDLLKEEFLQFLRDEKLKKNFGFNKDNLKSPFKSSTFYTNSKNFTSPRTRVSKEDAILLEELNFLLRDHLKEGEKKKNCKHCIIKFKKSSVIFNLIFGNFSNYFKDFYKTDFFLLEKLFKSSTSKQNNHGILIEFTSSQRLKTQIYKDLPTNDNKNKKYVVSLNWPLLLVTIDKGFFKNNMTIHCSKAITIKTKISEEEKEEEEENKEEKVNSPQRKNFFSSIISPEKKNLLSPKKENTFAEALHRAEKNESPSWDDIHLEEDPEKNQPV